MILLTHPFGNANVRAVLHALDDAGLLAKFLTTLGWSTSSPFVQLLPANWRAQALRRAYELPHYKIKTRPAREIVRLLAEKFGLGWLTRHETGWASIDRVWGRLDQVAADYLRENHERLKIHGVYAYEDCAARTFENARQLGLRRIYDLPIAYWETAQRLLRAEAIRYPQWEPTLGGTRDSEEKLARKTLELDLAEVVICPSDFVLDSLPERTRVSKKCVVAPFGSPAEIGDKSHVPHKTHNGRMRFLFAGALTQRKGLADLFAAMKLVSSKEAELVVMGSLTQPMRFYRNEFPDFVYEPPRPHDAVLRLMRSCDVLVLPSIVEGRALVQQEAMACGLPLIATRNAGGEDLIVDGKTGFLVPPGAPAAIAEKIGWFLQNRGQLPAMSAAARAKAAELTWAVYVEKVLHAIGH
ncbi:MAG: glycosyltransferase family 4 protein [Verrucomicrobiaceae bacterium]|nr:glycosyltransferase family 4 protein [Verrucomicrobiaceae bacterium]